MINRSSIRNRWIALLLTVLLTIPLLAWNALPERASHGTIEESRTFKNVATQSISSQATSSGNIETGQSLFMGRLHFKNDGPSCMGCHNVGQNGLLGGGAMGPDLTNVSTRRSDKEILGILSNTGEIISPVMQPIYKDFPLTNQEQADLLAFVKSSAGQTESNKEFLVFGISVAGFVAAVVMLGFIYRGRLRGVRKALVKKAQANNK